MCPYLEDEAIFELHRLKDSLEHLEISSCGDVSDKGLASLAQLQLVSVSFRIWYNSILNLICMQYSKSTVCILPL